MDNSMNNVTAVVNSYDLNTTDIFNYAEDIYVRSNEANEQLNGIALYILYMK